MKKALRKLIPTLVMVLIAASMVGTSTYAWFSMNTQVTVTGLEVEVKSNDTYLLVSTTNTTASTIQGQKATTDSVTIADAEVFPAAPVRSSGEAAYVTTSGKTVAGATITTAGVQVTDAATAAAVTNWYTASATGPDTSAIKTDTARQLAAFADYVIVEHAYLTVAAGANSAYQLSVTPTITAKAGTPTNINAVRVLVVTNDGGITILNKDSGKTDIKGSDTAITDSTVRIVDIYIYYDGNDSAVYTNNKANLAGADIELQFDVELDPYVAP